MTTGYLILIGVVALVLAGIIWDSLRSGRAFCAPLPPPYRSRGSQEDAWRQRWDAEAMEKADALLKMLCDSFSFNPDHRYNFAPDDRLQDIYRSRYPRWKFWQLGDSMEIESLGMSLEEQFGIDISEQYPSVTLGDIVVLALNRANSA